MNDGLLISSNTAKTTKLKGLEKLLKPAGGVSTASVSSAGGGTPGLSAFAIVDGAKLLQNDLAEEEVMSSALENKIPIVLENSNKEVTSALTGTGVDQDVVVLKSEGNRFTLSLIAQDKPISLTATGAGKDMDMGTVEKDLQAQGGSKGVSAVGKSVVSSTGSEASIMERVENALLAPVG
jgi:hypothetical protein